MAKQMIISVMSKDRPGIIADVTGAIYELNGSLADLKQSVLCGYFTMILTASFVDSVTANEVAEKISGVESETRLEVVVKDFVGTIHSELDYGNSNIYVITAQGVNRNGLVARMGGLCFGYGINILDFDTAVSDGLYSMILHVDLSGVASVEDIYMAVEHFGKETGLDVVMQHSDIFKATNDIALL